MSFTATGLDVTSRGGSLGGLKVSFRFWMRDRYHGSSTPATSSRDRWSSAFARNGLLGCDRSAILIHQLSGRAAVYSLLDAHPDHAVTAFGNSTRMELRPQCSTFSGQASCKNNDIRPGCVPYRGRFRDSIFGIVAPGGRLRQNWSDADYCRAKLAGPDRGRCADSPGV